MPLDYSAEGVRALSYSKLECLHRCPRKFQIENEFRVNTGRRKSVTFSYGHAVGMGIQATAEGDSLDRVILRTWLAWDLPLDEEGTLSEQRALKSPWFAIDAAERWYADVHDERKSDLRGWKVAQLPDPNNEGEFISGVELTFTIDCGGGFVYDGHIDLLLINEEETKFKVLELKTSGSNQLHAAMYKNSLQAVGYSVVIDKAAEALGISSAYDVLYEIYQTKQQKYTALPFVKSHAHRTIFLANLVSDINTIMAYEEQEYYPVNGSSCYSFFRPCEYFDVCHLSDDALRRMANSNEEEVFETNEESFATFSFTLEDLLEIQEAHTIPVQEL